MLLVLSIPTSLLGISSNYNIQLNGMITKHEKKTNQTKKPVQYPNAAFKYYCVRFPISGLGLCLCISSVTGIFKREVPHRHPPPVERGSEHHRHLRSTEMLYPPAKLLSPVQGQVSPLLALWHMVPPANVE